MTTLLLAAFMLAGAASFICYRAFVPGRDVVESARGNTPTNIALYHEYAAELELLQASGAGNNNGDDDNKDDDDNDQRQALLIEAQRQLLIDQVDDGGAGDGGESVVEQKHGRALLVVAAGVLMVVAAALYWQFGAIQDMQIRSLLETPDQASGPTLRRALVNRLGQRDDNLYYWMLLARIEQEAGQGAAAVQAYRRALALAPDDAEVNAELAQAIFVDSDQHITEEATSLVSRALALDPDNGLALELAGVAAFSQADYSNAVTYWQRALSLLPPDSGNARALQAGVAKAVSLQGTNAEAALLTVQVNLAEALRDPSLSPTSLVYVYARQWQGPPMPLVAQRYTVADLPVEVNFTDAMSLAASRKLSAVDQIEVIVRVALSGSLQAVSGDLEGRIGPLSISEQRHYKVTIDRRVP